ncbi:prolyl 3-hydroxylase 1 [Latimeria chalumnae]|uniref:prolyl 3-hydroxylase 1 n=1 Tax=Latimeria chalumnae TaxID=7897 RepID=UPI00313D9639
MAGASLPLVFSLLPFLVCVCARLMRGEAAFLEPYDILYHAGVNAYFRNDWVVAVQHLERALLNFAALKQVKVECYRRCGEEADFPEPEGLQQKPLPDLRFFDTIFKKAECLGFCETERLGTASLHRVGEDVKIDFEKRTPYNFLQVAYYQLKKLDKAVAAAHTFFIANPEHLEMQQNLQKYKKMSGVSERSFQDLEARPHWIAYDKGLKLYTAEKFQEAVTQFELSLTESLSALEECRALCEGPFEFQEATLSDYRRDLYEAITDHYIQVLRCRQNCVLEVATRPGRISPVKNFIPSHFEYLQFSYFSAGDLEKALESCKTFLLFYSEDSTMLQNLRYYEASLGVELAALVAVREVIKRYIQRSVLEKRMLYSVAESFEFLFNDPDSWTPEDIAPKSLMEKMKQEWEKIQQDLRRQREMEQSFHLQEGGTLPYTNVVLTLDSKQLNGSHRIVLDGVLTTVQCEALCQLSNAVPVAGDGYRGRRSPHTPHEHFHGLTVLKALKLARLGSVEQNDARLYYDVSEKSRLLVESYFNLKSPLYFSFSHLVRRSAVEGQQENRLDLSHPVHADNCILDPEGKQCWKEPPAYIYRDLSGILYLNEDFEGGSFFFTDRDAKTVTAEVQPKCGRLVAFTSGGENPHGVRAVTRGHRYAIALWFTLSSQHREQERIQADELLELEEKSVPGKSGQADAGTDMTASPEPPDGEQKSVVKHRMGKVKQRSGERQGQVSGASGEPHSRDEL